jgi:hypothetical protein
MIDSFDPSSNVTDVSPLQLKKQESSMNSTKEGRQIDCNKIQPKSAASFNRQVQQPSATLVAKVKLFSRKQYLKQLASSSVTKGGTSNDSMPDMKSARLPIVANFDPAVNVTLVSIAQKAKHSTGRTLTKGGITIDRMPDPKNALPQIVLSFDSLQMSHQLDTCCQRNSPQGSLRLKLEYKSISVIHLERVIQSRSRETDQELQ